MKLIDLFSSHFYSMQHSCLREQGQTACGAIKGLLHGPNGEITISTMGFEPPTFLSYHLPVSVVSHSSPAETYTQIRECEQDCGVTPSLITSTNTEVNSNTCCKICLQFHAVWSPHITYGQWLCSHCHTAGRTCVSQQQDGV